jgi:hypothetical protein
MAFGDRDFEIKIRTTADTTGIKQAEAELSKLSKGPPPIPPQWGEAIAGLVPVAELATAAVTAIGVAAYKTLKDISEFSAQLNEELGKQVIALDKASRKWSELATAADSIRDIAQVANSVVPAIEAMEDRTRKLNSTTLTMGQSFQEAGALILGLSQGLPQVWLPYTQALKDAQEEQKKLNDSMIETAATAIESAQQSKEAWDNLGLEPVYKQVEILTAKTQVYHDLIGDLNLRTKEGLELYKIYADALAKVEAALDKATAAQQRENDAIDAAADAFNRKQTADNEARAREKQRADEKAQRDNDKAGEEAARDKEKAGTQAEKDLAGASPQARAILANEQAEQRARNRGDVIAADQFARTADEFRRGATPKQLQEADRIDREMRGVKEGDPAVISELQKQTQKLDGILDAWQ